ncbi:MAG: DUF6748 domain-containing protein [Kofleriaceae bacterium]
MLRTVSFAAVSLFTLAIAPMGCASQDESDELAGEAEDVSESKADAAGVYTYFELSGDTRRCVYPLCGGFWLDRLNASTTKCHTGSTAEACYTPSLDWSESGLDQAQQDLVRNAAGKGSFDGVYAIVRGRFAKKNTDTPMPNLGRFIVTEAWVAVGEGQSDGVFAKVKDNGIRCIVAPCPSTTEYALNSSRTANIAEVDFTAGDLSDAAIEGLVSDLATDGFIVAGDRYNFKIQKRPGKGRTATNAYRNVKNLAPAGGGECFVGGCSGQICSDNPGVISTCEWRAEYACYQTATCERQAGGECGWTQTSELQACLASPPPL